MLTKSMEIVFFGILAVSGTATFSQTASQPTYSVGDTWTHRTVDDWTGKVRSESISTIIGQLDEFVRLSIDTKIFSTLGVATAAPSNDVTQRANFDTAFTFNGKASTRINMAWPLSPGKQWSYEYVVPNFTANTNVPTTATTYKMSAEVMQWEEIQVPAGKFRSIRVVHSGTWDSGSTSSKMAYTYWYAPTIKRFVKYQLQITGSDGSPSTRETIDLLSYRVNSQ